LLASDQESELPTRLEGLCRHLEKAIDQASADDLAVSKERAEKALDYINEYLELTDKLGALFDETTLLLTNEKSGLLVKTQNSLDNCLQALRYLSDEKFLRQEKRLVELKDILHVPEDTAPKTLTSPETAPDKLPQDKLQQLPEDLPALAQHVTPKYFLGDEERRESTAQQETAAKNVPIHERNVLLPIRDLTKRRSFGAFKEERELQPTAPTAHGVDTEQDVYFDVLHDEALADLHPSKKGRQDNFFGIDCRNVREPCSARREGLTRLFEEVFHKSPIPVQKRLRKFRVPEECQTDGPFDAKWLKKCKRSAWLALHPDKLQDEDLTHLQDLKEAREKLLSCGLLCQSDDQNDGLRPRSTIGTAEKIGAVMR
jgi:hypothetical protein